MRFNTDGRTLLLASLVAVFCVACAGKSMSISNAVDDATITARVKTALLNDPNVGALKIDVSTTAGVVAISGSVRSRTEEQRAIAVARQVPGVKDVRSDLRTGS
jgi:hyperosmotically inducible protein